MMCVLPLQNYNMEAIFESPFFDVSVFFIILSVSSDTLFISCGDAFLFKAVKESDENKKEQYYKECFERYNKANKYSKNPNEYNKILGLACMYRDCEGDLNQAANYFSTADVDISILPKLKNSNKMDVAKIMLDKDVFFQETTKGFSEEEKDKYKKIYIVSLEIMSELQIQDENANEMPVA